MLLEKPKGVRNVKRVKIADINVGQRHRRDLGELSDLAESIKDLGLLQPIGVTQDSDGSLHLAFGQRRLEATRSLGEDEIDARIVTCDPQFAEHDENEMRKEFTISERASFAAVIRERLSTRKMGRPSKKDAENGKDGQLSDISGPTSEIVAARTGFSTGKTLERAEAVIKKGAAKLIEAMDEKAVSISDAAAIVDLPKSKQVEALEKVNDGSAKTLREAAGIKGKPPGRPKGSVKTPGKPPREFFKYEGGSEKKRKTHKAIMALARFLGDLGLYVKYDKTLQAMCQDVKSVRE